VRALESGNLPRPPPPRRRRLHAPVPKFQIFGDKHSTRPKYTPLDLQSTRLLWQDPNSIDEAFHFFRYTNGWDYLDTRYAFVNSTVPPKLNPVRSSIMAAHLNDNSMISMSNPHSIGMSLTKRSCVRNG
jgi:hypothetical protein